MKKKHETRTSRQAHRRQIIIIIIIDQKHACSAPPNFNPKIRIPAHTLPPSQSENSYRTRDCTAEIAETTLSVSLHISTISRLSPKLSSTATLPPEARIKPVVSG